MGGLRSGGLSVRQRQAWPGGAERSQAIGLRGQDRTLVGVVLVQLGDMDLRLRRELDGVRHGGLGASRQRIVVVVAEWRQGDGRCRLRAAVTRRVDRLARFAWNRNLS